MKFVHDALRSELELHVDGKRIKKAPLEISPNFDIKMPVCLGGIEGRNQRYHGQVRGVWLGNIK